jgi:hypothetical protein
MRRLLAYLGVIAGLAGMAQAADPLPIFDAHVHYSEPAWAEHPPKSVVAALREAGVARALVSSSPDDGSLTLQKADPARFVPFLRPYRGPWKSANWTSDSDLGAYLESRLNAGRYAGIGEFHIFDPALVNTPQVKRVVELAIQRNLFLHIHSDAKPVRALFTLEPRLKILWAHAGMSEPPETVREMLDTYPALWTELSFRAGDIAPGGTLAPAWRAVFERHKDRFLVGTDTYVTPRWAEYRGLVEQHRRWLNQLPRDLGERIAWRNAVALFGGNTQLAN